jgi:DNA processing protein
MSKNMQHTIQEILLHLSLIPALHPKIAHELFAMPASNSLHDIYDFSVSDFEKHGVATKYAQRLVQGLQDKAVLEQELDLIKQHQVKLVTIACDQYPALLRQIHVPPVVLYCQGDVSLLAHQKNIACVGARKAHAYAYDVIKHLICPMIQDNWCIVSGGALGADTYAHQIALDYAGKTIVVVGSGLCHQYPSSNKALFEKIIAAGGLIVSSFAMATMPEPWCFPQRNRLISGLSQGCVVIQAAQRSGALITAHAALEQGREVFAVPGSIFDPLSAGCHELIAQGAKLVTCTQDIFDELGVVANLDQIAQQSVFQPPLHDELSTQILATCTSAISADYLVSKLNVDIMALQNKLFDLSLEGKIEQDAMGFWKRL